MEAESFGDTGVSQFVGDSSDDSDYLDEFDNFGYEALDRSCKIIYPDQPNPLQSMPMVKIWLGGSDPIDFIRMYANEGDLSKQIPPHWHYITFGFSDLYGDERVHRRAHRGDPSGFGFELTFRVKKDLDDSIPPSWPTMFINKLAKYVFQTGNVLHVGDHIPYHSPLDGEGSSKIQHLLVAEDPQLLDLDTPYGTVEFRQVVGVMDDEIKAAQKWKGAGMLQLLFQAPDIGPFFVTDMDRQKSVFDRNPDLRTMISEGIEKDGSNLGHVTAIFSWSALEADSSASQDKCSSMSGAGEASDNSGSTSDNKENETFSEEKEIPLQHVDSVQLCFDAESAELLPMVIRGRLKKGRFFIFRNADNMAVHLVPFTDKDECIFVNDVEPMQALGTELQIFCSSTFIEEMSDVFEDLQTLDEDITKYPKEYTFSHPSIQVKVFPRGKLSMSSPETPEKQ